MALIAYQQRARMLLQDAAFARYRDGDLISYINTARGQVAGEGECIRLVSTIPTVIGQQGYNFSAITIPGGAGYQSVLAVRQIGASGVLLTPRTWEWVFQYYIAPATPNAGPVDWAQLGQGTSGSFYLGPTPNVVETLRLDLVMEPQPLATDADVEAIPYPFTDAIPYFAAYVALLTAREDAVAQSMYQNYERFMLRARAMGTPTVLPQQYPGSMGARLASEAVPVVPPASVGGSAQAGRGA